MKKFFRVLEDIYRHRYTHVILEDLKQFTLLIPLRYLCLSPVCIHILVNASLLRYYALKNCRKLIGFST